MSGPPIFVSGPDIPETLLGSFAGSLIAALEQAGAETYYHSQALSPLVDPLTLRHAISLRPVSIILIPPSLASATTPLHTTLPAELRHQQGIMAFNPTRLVLSVPLEHATPDVWSTFHIPDYLAVQDGVTPEIQGQVIARILELLALSSASTVSDRPFGEAPHFEAASPKDQLIYSKALNLQGAHREAREVLCRLAPDTPKDTGVWTNLGYTYTLLEEWAEAVEASKRAFEMLERTTSSRCLGTSLLGLGQYEDACSGFRRALATHSNYGAAWLGLGNALLALGRHEEAREAFERIEYLKPDNPWAYEDEENVIRARQYLEDLLY